MLYCAAPCRAMPCHAMPCRAVPCRGTPRRATPRHAAPRRAGRVALRRGTVYCAILSRVAWLVVSFLYSFVGKSAASLVFKRRQREGRWKERVGRWEGETATRWGRTEAKEKRRLVSGGCERDRRERNDGSVVRKGRRESPACAVRQ
jgi:hypothetical protein